MDLFERVSAPESLSRAWTAVLANDAEDGSLSWGVSRFAEDADARLTALAEDLDRGTFEPGLLVALDLVQDDKVRQLHVPAVRDRIVARAVLDMATALLDPHLGTAAFAYRPGLGVVDAVQRVATLRDEGLCWVLRTDVRDCFPTLPKALAVRRFQALIDDPRVGDLMEGLAARVYRTPSGSLRPLAGLPQGCPLSPVLANLVLVDIDNGLQAAGFPVVRYGDDIAAFAQTRDDAWECARLASALVEEHGMTLGSDKTRVASFEEGFAFLGEEFGPRYPPTLDDHRCVDPDERVLYVGLQGSRVRIAAGRLLVESADDARILDVPTTQVARVVCFGSVGVSAGARTWALANDVDIVLASRSGNYLGTMLSHGRRYRPARLRAQLAMDGSAQALRLAQAIVASKIHKQQIVLRRANRRDSADTVRDVIGQLTQLEQMVTQATAPAELMGLEGAAAARYFPCFGAMMPEGLEFTLRSRRPPRDVANAALSYLYTILLGECVTALQAAGLDPAIGVLHSDQDNRPSLALDLMEEFRPFVVDSVVMTAARLRALTPAHGREEPGAGTLLTKAGEEALLTSYEKRLLTKTGGALPDFSGTIRAHLYRQAHRLRASIMDHDEPWTGLSWR